MSNSTSPRDEPDDPGDPDDGADPAAHLDDVPDGAGCALVWERTSEKRASERAASD